MGGLFRYILPPHLAEVPKESVSFTHTFLSPIPDGTVTFIEEVNGIAPAKLESGRSEQRVEYGAFAATLTAAALPEFRCRVTFGLVVMQPGSFGLLVYLAAESQELRYALEKDVQVRGVEEGAGV